jgi:hypothetical protein
MPEFERSTQISYYLTRASRIPAPSSQKLVLQAHAIATITM